MWGVSSEVVLPQGKLGSLLGPLSLVSDGLGFEAGRAVGDDFLRQLGVELFGVTSEVRHLVRVELERLGGHQLIDHIADDAETLGRVAEELRVNGALLLEQLDRLVKVLDLSELVAVLLEIAQDPGPHAFSHLFCLSHRLQPKAIVDFLGSTTLVDRANR